MEREKRTEVGERMKAVIGRDLAVLAIEIEKSEKKSKREEGEKAGCCSISDGEVHDKLFDLFLFCFVFLIFLKRF